MSGDTQHTAGDTGSPTGGHRRLSRQMLLTYGGILVVASLAFSAFLVLHTHQEWQADAGAFARYLARAIALDVRQPLLANDTTALARKLDSIGHADLVSLACVYDHTALVSAFSKAATGAPLRVCPPDQNQSVAGTIHALETVDSEDTSVGYVTVHVDSQLVLSRTISRVAPTLGVLLLVVAAVLFATHAASARVTASLTTLTGFARTTPFTAPQFPPIPRAPLEVAELADAFRRLVDNLVEARRVASQEAATRRLAEGSERQAHDLLRSIVNNVPHVIIVRRGDGSMLFANRAAATLYGVTVEAMGEPGFGSTSGQPDGLLVAASGATYPREIDFTDAAGMQHRLLVSRAFIEGSDQELTLALDITDVHRLQAQLHFAQRLETVGTLAGGIAHDFNNLLTPILGYSTLLEALPLPEDVKVRLGHITNAAMKARHVVQQILTFSRQRPPARSRVSIRSLVSDTISLMRATIPAHIDIRLEAGSDTWVDADPGQIEQVLVNLVTNAAQAIGNQPGTIIIRLSRQLGDNGRDHLVIEIADTGAGMSAEIMSHIFEPFFTTKGVGEGSGLGLAVVHGIIKSHDGEIRVKSVPGQGTSFTLLLPAAGSPAPKDPVANPAPAY